MEVSAVLRGAQLSAQRGRLVADLIRKKKKNRETGKLEHLKVSDAIDILEFSNKKGAKIVKKLLESAISNAEHNNGADIDELYISKIFVDEGPVLKRIKSRAKGRANRILKRSCHITVSVTESGHSDGEV